MMSEIGSAHDLHKTVELSRGSPASWARKAVDIDITNSLELQVVHVDYYTGFSPSSSRQMGTEVAILRVYGVTDDGNSVLAHVHNFDPYFYVPCWPSCGASDITAFKSALGAELKRSQTGRDLKHPELVTHVEVVKKKSLWGYHADSSDFLKIYMAQPKLVPTARRLLENGLSFAGSTRHFQTYESNIPYALRFMVDRDVRGGGWVELCQGKFKMRAASRKVARCQIECDIDWRQIQAHNATSGRYIRLAPLRILSFDIECAGRKNVFPEPDTDPVIQIANLVTVQGRDTPIIKNVFTLKSCARIAGSHVISFEHEAELLMAWAEFVLSVDADVITGYNIINFDIPYLIQRAEALAKEGSNPKSRDAIKMKCDKFPYLGRITNAKSRIKESTFTSKAFGTRTNKDINIEGRIQFDVLTVLRKEYKLRSYSLNAVSSHFLKNQKEDVHYNIITDLQNGTDETRRRLAVYCLKDAELPTLLMNKLMLLINHVEMARVTGVPISFLLTRGQQIKVVSQLLRKAAQHDLLIPVRQKRGSEDGVQYEGATVIEPKRAYYQIPITTLDFASLYPSIMMAHNLCYTTMISKGEAAAMDSSEFTETPIGAYFVNASKRKGLLPEILHELLSARKRAKKDMKEATDPLTKAVLNGRQLALKISANSVYGFTGAVVGSLPCLNISSSVTSFGRNMINETKKKVEEHYTRSNGYEFDADVVYGDTDSVMIRFGDKDLAKCMELGEEAAGLVSGIFKDPIRLEFEKVYFPYLLMNKKRYAGMLWTTPQKWDYMDCKGIETVRRDNCPLVKEVVQVCLDKILKEQDVPGALAYTKSTISRLLQNRVDLSMLVITKQLGKMSEELQEAMADEEGGKKKKKKKKLSKKGTYKVNLPHVALAERMAKRDAGSAPHVGDRVAYVIVQGTKAQAQYEKAEDPIYVLEHGLPLDTHYYVENQLTQPLTRIFEPILKKDISKLFAGDHTRQIKKSTSKIGALMKFAVSTNTCAGCRVPLHSEDRAVCEHCSPNEANLYVEQQLLVRKHEKSFSELWTQCQRCQGSLHQDVICQSRDCPIFYRRTKARKDLEEARSTLEKFGM